MTKNLRYAVLALVLPLLAAPALPAAQPVVDVSLGPDSIELRPRVEYDSMVITLSGGGKDIRRELGSDEHPALSLVDEAGLALPDGVYTWEVRLAPTADQLRARVRNNNELGGAAPDAGSVDYELVESGSFTLRDGTVVDPGLREDGGGTARLSAPAALSPMSAAQTIYGDLSVYNSLCVGFDCATSESYGYDTVRLKENNLRIHFDDTSTVSSFPRNDWRIIANDSANGGASYLAFEDSTAGRVPFRVVAGARSNALYVDSQGDVGIGTSTPFTEVHAVVGDTPTLRLEQNSSSGFAPQTWDVAGNETNFFIRDVTNGSRLSLRIRPGAPTSSIDVAGNGNVGIGTSSPSARLDVTNVGSSTDNFASVELTNTGATNNQTWTFANNGTNGAFLIDNGTIGNSAFRVFPNASTNLMDLGGAGAGLASTVTVNGTLNVTTAIQLGGSQVHPDYVFEAGYPLPSIAEQGRFMMQNKHLPAVGEGEGPIDLGRHQLAVLEELEKAHLYIQQLHGAIEQLQAQQTESSELAARVAALEAMVETLQGDAPKMALRP